MTLRVPGSCLWGPAEGTLARPHERDRIAGQRRCPDTVSQADRRLTTHTRRCGVEEQRFTLTVRGPLAERGRIAVSELVRILGELQGELERVALVLTGEQSSARGRRSKDVVDAVRLDLVAISEGSATLELEPHESQLPLIPDNPLMESFRVLVEGIGQIESDPSGSPPRGFDRGVVQGLLDMTRSLGAGVDAIAIRGPGISTRVLTTSTKDRIRTALAVSAETQPRQVAGRLTMGDFAPSALRCRIDTPTGSVVCDFEHDLRPQVLDAMDRFVRAAGAAEIIQPAGDVRVLHIESLAVVDESQAGELGDLITAQRAKAIGTAKDLRGEPIDDFDEFLAAIGSLRTDS